MQRQVANSLRLIIALTAIGLAISSPDLPIHAGEVVLSEFNNTGASYAFGSLNYLTGPNTLRVVGPTDSGGVGFFSPLNLTSHADSRFAVDLFTSPTNTVDHFDLELIDSAGNGGKWSLGVSHLDDGVTSTLVSATTLNNPTHGNNFSNLDLSNITQWQIVGSYGTPAPFDLNFDRVVVSDSVAAPPPYPGAESDAPWRAEAANRINANRMADLNVRVTDSLGNAISGAEVAVRMTRHEFGFGSAVRAKNLRDLQPQYAAYKGKVAELFNIVVIENNLKWEPWNGEWGNDWTQQGARNAVDWLVGRDIDIRGHNLVWPGISEVANPAKSLLQDFVDNGTPLTENQQAQLRTLIADHIADVAGTFAGDLAAWDVINEPRANHDVMDALDEGDLAMIDWFQQAAAADPNATRYINDYGILPGGGTNTFNQQDYIDRIQFLLDNNAPIEGVGFQSHFRESDLTGPEQLWEIIDRFKGFGLEMQITEFDFETTNEQLQAEYTRDFLTAMFAHEDIDDILTWGFWEDAHWRPDAAMFRSDWSIKPNGQAYLDLVFGDWWTEEDLVTELTGLATLRGFKGEYEITVSINGIEQIVSATLTEGGLELDIVLTELLSADFDGNGTVDQNDLAVFENNYGQAAIQTTGDANGDGQVDGRDLLIWQQQYGMSTASQLSTVPEPSTWSIACLTAMLFCHSRRQFS